MFILIRRQNSIYMFLDFNLIRPLFRHHYYKNSTGMIRLLNENLLVFRFLISLSLEPVLAATFKSQLFQLKRMSRSGVRKMKSALKPLLEIYLAKEMRRECENTHNITSRK